MHNFIFVRHGQSQSNVDISILNTVPDPLIELTQVGWEQAERVAQLLQERVVYSSVWTSSYKRAAQTASIIANTLNVEPRKSTLLVERSFGILSGDISEYQNSFPSVQDHYKLYEANNATFFTKPIGGESYNDVTVRLNQALQQIVKVDSALGCNTSIVVTHKQVIRAAMVMAGELSCWDVESFDVPNCSIISHSTDIYDK